MRWPWAATPSLDKAHECSIHLPPPTKTPRPTPLLPWPAKAHEHQLVARGGTGNHATSGLKFRLLIPWLKVGCPNPSPHPRPHLPPSLSLSLSLTLSLSLSLSLTPTLPLTLTPWLKVGCNVLLSDVDVVYMRNPFQAQLLRVRVRVGARDGVRVSNPFHAQPSPPADTATPCPDTVPFIGTSPPTAPSPSISPSRCLLPSSTATPTSRR